MQKKDYVTILRALAILPVLAVHCTFLLDVKPLPSILLTTFNNGETGVLLFYLLSAFTLYLTSSYRSGNEQYPNLSFFLRRFFRIAPLFYLATLYFLLQNGRGPNFWMGDGPGVSKANIAAHFLLLHGFSPYWINSIVPGGWSVGIEFIFYCMFPFLFKRIRNMQQAVNFTLITLAIRAVLLGILTQYPLIHEKYLWQVFLYFYLPNQLPVFSLGFWLYFILFQRDKLRISGTTILVVALLGIASLATGTDYFIPKTVAWGFAFLALAIGLTRYKPRVLFNPVINYIGTISYTIYLTHEGAIHWLIRFHIVNPLKEQGTVPAVCNLFIDYLLVLAASVGVSSIAYHFAEKPMLDYGKRLVAKINSRNGSRRSVTVQPELTDHS
jgi:peptidoglycan/LPS O-acetylase OafA/YrhL